MTEAAPEQVEPPVSPPPVNEPVPPPPAAPADAAPSTAPAGGDTPPPPDAASQSPAWPDEWREMSAGNDEDLLKLAKRYGSVGGILKALKDAKDTIRSGRLLRPMPDSSDPKVMSEWRKEQGIPEDATGYKFPDSVIKRMTDDDKPMMASFTDYAHKRGAPQSVVDIAAEWYFDQVEQASSKRSAEDAASVEAAEDALRKQWSNGEYKANKALAERFLETIPGLKGMGLAQLVLTNGKVAGADPDFIMWAADQGRSHFGDVAFATADGEARHMSRKAEIEKIRNEDFDRYEREGLDKEMLAITERELARARPR